MKIEISNGELIDKLSILEIKAEKITSSEKLLNIKKELVLLREFSETVLSKCYSHYEKLKKINEELWDIEDKIRDLERSKNFGEEFVQTARQVYLFNDDRAAAKKEINMITGSELSEEKSYQKY